VHARARDRLAAHEGAAGRPHLHADLRRTQTIRVTGTLGKAAVRRSFKRTNGCEISDFARVLHALPIVAHTALRARS
jgi:hypothetical protein